MIVWCAIRENSHPLLSGPGARWPHEPTSASTHEQTDGEKMSGMTYLSKLTSGVFTPPQMVNSSDAARILGVSSSTVKVLVARGLLPAVNVGAGARQALRYNLADLEAFMAARATGGKPE